MSAGANPYAAFGGDVSGTSSDPYAAFGGSSLVSPNTPSQPQSTIGPAPKTSAMGVLAHIADIPVNPTAEIGSVIDALRQKLMESEHPAAQAVGQKLTDAKELLYGGQSVGKPMGTSGGIINNPVTAAMSGAIGPGEGIAPEAAPGAVEAVKGGVRAAGKAISGAIPSTERAGEAFSELEKSIGHEPVEITDRFSKALNELRDKTNYGNIPTTAQKLISRLDPLQGSGPLTYKEGRSFYKELGDIAFGDKSLANKDTLRLVRDARSALGETIQKTADVAGHGEKLADAMVEYKRGLMARNAWDAAKEHAWKAAVGALGVGVLKKVWDSF